MTEKVARILLDTQRSLDRLWHEQEGMSAATRLAATSMSFTITKTLQQGGWDLHFDPDKDCLDLHRLRPCDVD